VASHAVNMVHMTAAVLSRLLIFLGVNDG
jgi:hypothetical protein